LHTSATIVTDGDRAERRRRIAEAGRKLFGVEVPPDHVLEEPLQRVATVPVPQGREALAEAVRAEPTPPEREAVRSHPLAAWWVPNGPSEQPRRKLAVRQAFQAGTCIRT
jgi:hypothetical protein